MAKGLWNLTIAPTWACLRSHSKTMANQYGVDPPPPVAINMEFPSLWLEHPLLFSEGFPQDAKGVCVNLHHV